MGSDWVTIGLPVYNGARFLRAALDSLIAQDHPRLRIIISDNASTDETPDICREYAARDTRITYHREAQNRGAVWNFNRVVELARDDYFMWGAHDDLWDPRFVSRCIAELERHPEAAVCHSVSQPIDSRGAPVGDPTRGYVADAPSRTERWRTMMHRWELHAAIYGVLRTAAIRRTRLLQSGTLSCDFVFMCELMLQGTLIEVPELLSWKRVPDRGAAYRSAEEMMAYLSARSDVPRFMRLHILRECLRGIAHAQLDPLESARTTAETLLCYVQDHHWRADVRRELVDVFGEERLQRWTSRLRRA